METIIRKTQLPADFYVALNNRIVLGIIGLGLNELFADASFKDINARISLLLNRERYRSAMNTFTFKQLPLHWCLFFRMANIRFAPGVTGLLWIIKKITD